MHVPSQCSVSSRYTYITLRLNSKICLHLKYFYSTSFTNFYNNFNPVDGLFNVIFSCLVFSSLKANLFAFFSPLRSRFSSLTAFFRVFFSSNVSCLFRIDKTETRDANVLKLTKNVIKKLMRCSFTSRLTSISIVCGIKPADLNVFS